MVDNYNGFVAANGCVRNGCKGRKQKIATRMKRKVSQINDDCLRN